MASYRSIAIVGFGEVGSLILDEFIKAEAAQPGRGYKLRVLTRSKDKPEFAPYTSKGVDVIPVNYTSLESITHALKGVEVVLSTLRDDGLDLQINVIRAAKVANVKLFAPSEYGKNSLGETSDYLKPKADSHVVLKELGLPYTLFFIGLFPEMLLSNALGPSMGIDFEEGKFALFGDGNVPFSWTSPLSIAPFVHHVITTVPASELENRVINMEGDRKTLREIIGLWEAKHGRKAQVRVRTEKEVEKFKEEHPSSFYRFCVQKWQDGSFLNGGVDNGLYPEWKPLKWADVIP